MSTLLILAGVVALVIVVWKSFHASTNRRGGSDGGDAGLFFGDGGSGFTSDSTSDCSDSSSDGGSCDGGGGD
ncbi:hypothetical protein [Lysobacter fragariae]